MKKYLVCGFIVKFLVRLKNIQTINWTSEARFLSPLGWLACVCMCMLVRGYL